MEALKLSELNVNLPFFDTSISAGYPTPASDYRENEIDLSRILQPNPVNTFIIRVKGDSMAGANIPDGCLAMADRSIRPSTGDIIVAALDGDLTVRRLVKASRSWTLHAENEFFKPVTITEETAFQVLGVITAVIVDIRK